MISAISAICSMVSSSHEVVVSAAIRCNAVSPSSLQNVSTTHNVNLSKHGKLQFETEFSMGTQKVKSLRTMKDSIFPYKLHHDVNVGASQINELEKTTFVYIK